MCVPPLGSSYLAAREPGSVNTSIGLLIPKMKGGFIREKMGGRNIAYAIHGSPRVGLHTRYTEYAVGSPND